jgi:hypothetical protein
MGKSKVKTKAMKAGGRRQSSKKDKIRSNKNFRRKTKIAINTGIEEKIPKSIKEVSDVWDFASDGRAVYIPDLEKKYMRK